MSKFYIFFLFFFFLQNAIADTSPWCERMHKELDTIEEKASRLNEYDPDYIPLHRLFARELITELKEFKYQIERISNLDSCVTALHIRTQTLLANTTLTYQHLEEKNNVIETVFYEHALHEFEAGNYPQVIYLLDRSLEYNPLYPEALMLRAKILLEARDFVECVHLLDVLYNECELNLPQEEEAIQLSNLFYNTLYSAGDSLVKNNHAAEALEMFQFLEDFCHNMPTNYCNDDYYHGILKSQKGIYESYLVIANIAKQRGNKEVEEQFLTHAQAYLSDHQELVMRLEDEMTFIPLELTIAENSIGDVDILAIDKPNKTTPKETVPIEEEEISENRVVLKHHVPNPDEYTLPEEEYLNKPIPPTEIKTPSKPIATDTPEITTSEVREEEEDKELDLAIATPTPDEVSADTIETITLKDIAEEGHKTSTTTSTDVSVPEVKVQTTPTPKTVIASTGRATVVVSGARQTVNTKVVVVKYQNQQEEEVKEEISTKYDNIPTETLQQQYNQLVTYGVNKCIAGNTEAALRLLGEAEAISKARKLSTDLRVELLLEALRNM